MEGRKDACWWCGGCLLFLIIIMMTLPRGTFTFIFRRTCSCYCSTATMRSTAALAFLSLCGPPIVGATLVQELRFVTDAKEIIGKEGGDIVVIGLFGSSVRCECVVRAPSWERAYLGSTLVHDWLPCVLAGLG